MTEPWQSEIEFTNANARAWKTATNFPICTDPEGKLTLMIPVARHQNPRTWDPPYGYKFVSGVHDVASPTSYVGYRVQPVTARTVFRILMGSV